MNNLRNKCRDYHFPKLLFLILFHADQESAKKRGCLLLFYKRNLSLRNYPLNPAGRPELVGGGSLKSASGT